MATALSTTGAGHKLSSAEAEFYAMVTGATEAMFERSVFSELGQSSMMIEMRTDSAAAKACMERHGAQRMKHIAIRVMFLKDLVKSKLVRLKKVASANNIADLLTKPVNQQVQEHLLKSLSVVTFV